MSRCRLSPESAIFVIPYGLVLGFALPWLDPDTAFSCAVLAIPLIWLSSSDLKSHTIPDMATAAVAVVGGAASFLVRQEDLALTLFFSLGIFAALWLSSEAYWRRYGREALGLGDVKLIAAVALCVGPFDIWFALFLACIGGIVASLLTRGRSQECHQAVPFGPFIAYAAFLVFLSARVW